jgi:hypothetical protein
MFEYGGRVIAVAHHKKLIHDIKYSPPPPVKIYTFYLSIFQYGEYLINTNTGPDSAV